MNTYTIVVYLPPEALMDGVPYPALEEEYRYDVTADSYREAVEFAAGIYPYFRVLLPNESTP